MNPSWFDEIYYLTAKAALLNMGGGSYTATSLRSALGEMGITAYEHYTAYGDAEGISPSVQFNRFEYLTAKAAQLNRVKYEGKTNWTAKTVSDNLAKLGMTTGEHYATHGWQENVNPSNSFDTSSYLASKLAQVRTIPGADSTGKPYAQYEQSDLTAAFAAAGLDPIGHYRAYGASERIPVSVVPESERVESDPARPKNPVLSADGKTVTVHLTSPVKSSTIEAADFTLVLNGKEIAVSKAAAGTGTSSYDVVLTLDDANRQPGLLEGQSNTLHVVYNPDGGNKVKLETEAGVVAPFDSLVDNQSQCFTIAERTTEEREPIIGPDGNPVVDGEGNPTFNTIRTFHITLTPPANYVESTDTAAYVKIDLTSKTGVVNGGTYGIVTPPRLMDGSLVDNFDGTAVSSKVHLDIKARTEGGEIVTSDAADIINCGAGKDTIRFTSMTNSQLSHMDKVDKFTYSDAGTDKLLFPAGAVTDVIFKGPLSLEGSLDEAAIRGVFDGDGTPPMKANTAYVLQNGKDYLLIVDSDASGTFEAANDFALNLTGLTGLPTTLEPEAHLLGMLG